MRTNFIVWLSLGVVIGWFVSRMYELDYRRYKKIAADEKATSIKLSQDWQNQMCAVYAYATPIITKEEKWTFLNFVAWLTAGAIIGRFARRMIEAEHGRVVIPVNL